jgi:hypothetical protein
MSDVSSLTSHLPVVSIQLPLCGRFTIRLHAQHACSLFHLPYLPSQVFLFVHPFLVHLFFFHLVAVHRR